MSHDPRVVAIIEEMKKNGFVIDSKVPKSVTKTDGENKNAKQKRKAQEAEPIKQLLTKCQRVLREKQLYDINF